MKYWENKISTDLEYEVAKRQIRVYRPYYTTRPEWDGVHFYSKRGEYCILLKTGEVLINPKEIQDADKKDWMIVTITDEAVKILKKKKLI